MTHRGPRYQTSRSPCSWQWPLSALHVRRSSSRAGLSALSRSAAQSSKRSPPAGGPWGSVAPVLRSRCLLAAALHISRFLLRASSDISATSTLLFRYLEGGTQTLWCGATPLALCSHISSLMKNASQPDGSSSSSSSSSFTSGAGGGVIAPHTITITITSTSSCRRPVVTAVAVAVVLVVVVLVMVVSVTPQRSQLRLVLLISRSLSSTTLWYSASLPRVTVCMASSTARIAALTAFSMT
ncbi:hypothetical protein CRUP_028484 [Coryphaenoides rupestris]|nr:hypothetical protein CRUP_028484 [Coryphaenoides rupestris]